MEQPRYFKIQSPIGRGRYSFLLVAILFTLNACSVSVHTFSSLVSEPTAYFQGPGGYGLQQVQLDEDTYFIVYMSDRRVGDPQVAQEFVLYRAGEVAKSRGVNNFAVLHRDDWDFLSERGISIQSGPFSHRMKRLDDYDPGAGIVMRLVHESAMSVKRNDDRVYEVDTVLQQLPKRNRALADYVRTVPDESLIRDGWLRFHPWRSAVTVYESLSAYDRKFKGLYGKDHRDVTGHIETTVVPQTPSGSFEMSLSSMALIPPLYFLHKCVQLADQEGYEVFKITKWVEEEHISQGEKRYMWFRTTATISLQHQKEPKSLEPVFVVDEIRKGVEIGRLWPFTYYIESSGTTGLTR